MIKSTPWHWRFLGWNLFGATPAVIVMNICKVIISKWIEVASQSRELDRCSSCGVWKLRIVQAKEKKKKKYTTGLANDRSVTRELLNIFRSRFFHRSYSDDCNQNPVFAPIIRKIGIFSIENPHKRHFLRNSACVFYCLVMMLTLCLFLVVAHLEKYPHKTSMKTVKTYHTGLLPHPSSKLDLSSPSPVKSPH